MSKFTINIGVPASKDITTDIEKTLNKLYNLYPGLIKCKNLKVKVRLNKVKTKSKRNKK